MKKAVNPRMIVLARESRGLVQSELAKRLDIGQGALSKIEGGVSAGPDDLVDRLEMELGYPRNFFYQSDDVHGVGTESFHQLYRRRQALPAKSLKKIEAQVNIVRMHIAKLLNAVEFEPGHGIPKYDLEDFKGDVERVANTIRAAWMLPTGPIGNVTEVIENAGGIVIPFDFETDRVDATSFRYGSLPPLFFYNKNLTGDRLRFSLAHELGHMVLHAIVPSPKMEDEADRFASEFLMPAHEIGPSLNQLNLRKAAQMKPFWKVSMGAIIVRAKTIGKLTPNQYQHLWVQMGAAGWRKREPSELDIPVERPRFHRELLDMHFGELKYSIQELSQMLVIKEEDFCALHGLQSARSSIRLVRTN